MDPAYGPRAVHIQWHQHPFFFMCTFMLVLSIGSLSLYRTSVLFELMKNGPPTIYQNVTYEIATAYAVAEYNNIFHCTPFGLPDMIPLTYTMAKLARRSVLPRTILNCNGYQQFRADMQEYMAAYLLYQQYEKAVKDTTAKVVSGQQEWCRKFHRLAFNGHNPVAYLLCGSCEHDMFDPTNPTCAEQQLENADFLINERAARKNARKMG